MAAVKRALIVAAALTIGSGAGIILGDFVSPMNPEVGSLPVIVQPVALSLTVAFAHLVKPRSEYWASALAISLTAAMTAAGLRVAATALEFMRTPSEAPQALASLSFPQRVSDQSMLVLLGLSLALTLGQMLLAEGFVRQVSPLWIGVEALPTPITSPTRVGLKEYALGAPLGAFLAWLDLGVKLFTPSLVPWAYALLYMTTLPVATALTSSTHLLLQLALLRFDVPGDIMYSVRVGVQLGLVVSTIAAAVFLHTGGAAELYPKRIASLAVSMVGLLLLLLGYAVISVTYAVYLLVNTLILLLLAIFAIIRLEGGALVVFHPVYPIVPELLQLAWVLLTASSKEVLAMQNAEQLMRLTLNPSLVLMLTTMTLWDCRLVTGISSVALLPLSLSVPVLLLLARVISTHENYSFPPRLASWSLGAPPCDAPQPLYELSIAVAAATAVAIFFTYYAFSVSSHWRYITLVSDPSGLMFAYSVGRAISNRDLLAATLMLFTALNVARLFLVELRFWSKAKTYFYAANISYGAASAVLLCRSSP